jgi:hypothetical protein
MNLYIFVETIRSNFLDIFLDFFLFLQFVLLFTQNDPVVLVVILVAVALEQVLKHVPHDCVLGSLVEAEVSALAQVLHELNGITLAQHFDRGCQLLLLDPFVFVPLVVGLESLPREHSSQEVHGDVADALHVVSAGLLDTQVSVDGGVPGGSSQVLSLSVGNVLAVSLDIPLGEPKIKKEHFVASFVVAHAEVIRFDISVDEVPVVDVLDPGDHLVDQHQDCLQGELPESVLKK